MIELNDKAAKLWDQYLAAVDSQTGEIETPEKKAALVKQAADNFAQGFLQLHSSEDLEEMKRDGFVIHGVPGTIKLPVFVLGSFSEVTTKQAQSEQLNTTFNEYLKVSGNTMKQFQDASFEEKQKMMAAAFATSKFTVSEEALKLWGNQVQIGLNDAQIQNTLQQVRKARADADAATKTLAEATGWSEEEIGKHSPNEIYEQVRKKIGDKSFAVVAAAADAMTKLAGASAANEEAAGKIADALAKSGSYTLMAKGREWLAKHPDASPAELIAHHATAAEQSALVKFETDMENRELTRQNRMQAEMTTHIMQEFMPMVDGIANGGNVPGIMRQMVANSWRGGGGGLGALKIADAAGEAPASNQRVQRPTGPEVLPS
jgi:uncharacterized protein YecA (UPF0149 family)